MSKIRISSTLPVNAFTEEHALETLVILHSLHTQCLEQLTPFAVNLALLHFLEMSLQ